MLSLAVVGLSTTVLAQQATTGSERLSIDPTAGIRFRRYTNPDGTTSKNDLDYNFDLKVTLKLVDGKLKVVGNGVTGTSPDDPFNHAGVGSSSSSFGHAMALRTMSLQYTPTETIAISGGALNAIADGISSDGAFQLDRSTWVDGARVSFSKIAQWADQITVTVGKAANASSSGNLFDRDIGLDTLKNQDFIQVQMKGNLSKRLKYLAEGTEFNETDYLRGVAEIATDDVVKFVDAIVIEDMVSTSRSLTGITHEGFAASMKKAINGYNVQGGYSYKSAAISARGPNNLLLQNETMSGKAINLSVERPTKWGSMYLAGSKGVGKGTDVTSRSNSQFQVGAKVNASSIKNLFKKN